MAQAETIFACCPDERHSLGSISNETGVGIDVLQALTVKSGCFKHINQGGNAGRLPSLIIIRDGSLFYIQNLGGI